MNKINLSEATLLRAKAEAFLKNNSSGTDLRFSEVDALKLIHELQVYQVELELQNQELILSNKEAELATKKYNELFNFTLIGYFTLSINGEIKEVNLKGAIILGKDQSELINRRFGVYISDESKPAFNLFLSNIFNSLELQTCEVTLEANHLAPIALTLTGIISKNANQCVITAVDISESYRKIEILKQNDKFLREIQELAQLGAYSFDIVADKWISSEVLDHIFGISSDFVKSFESWTSIIHPDWQQVMADYFRDEVIGKNGIFDKEYKIVRLNDKTERWVYGKGEVKYNILNQPILMVGTIRDITERKFTEEEIKRKNAELENVIAEKDKFFSIIAHDLRGPFNGFLGLTEIMAKELNTLTTDDLQKISISLNNSANNLYSLLTNLLEWARIQQDAIKFEPKSLLVLHVVTSTIQPLVDLAEKKGIAVTLDIPENIEVIADENMLASTIRNFASNAVKFTPSGGFVNISAKPSGDDNIVFAVKDSGIGMNAEMISNLFKLDANIGRKGTADEPSTGLGLLLCNEFIRKHGGRIWVESSTQEGSTFYFILPKSNLTQNS